MFATIRQNVIASCKEPLHGPLGAKLAYQEPAIACRSELVTGAAETKSLHADSRLVSECGNA